MTNFRSYPQKSVFIIVINDSEKGLEHMEIVSKPFDNAFQAQDWIAENFTSETIQVLSVKEIKVPDLTVQKEDMDCAKEIIKKNCNKEYTPEELEIEARKYIRDTKSSYYFISTPFVDAYDTNDRLAAGEYENFSIFQFEKKMKVQAETWGNRISEFYDGEPATYKGESVKAFGEFNGKYYVYTEKLIEVPKIYIGVDWDVT